MVKSKAQDVQHVAGIGPLHNPDIPTGEHVIDVHLEP